MDATNNIVMISDNISNTTDVQEFLTGSGWMIHTVEGLCEKSIREKLEVCDAGVVFFSNDTAKHMDMIEKIVSLSRFEWLALIPKPTLNKLPLRKSIKKCFYAYLTHPYHYSHIDCLLRHAVSINRLDDEETGVQATPDGLQVVGLSAQMKRLLATIQRVSSVDAPVFISGESGTGKELAARSIHQRSKRAEGPFIAVNCGALPPELIQSELFGHEKGAFTGANQQKTGRIEAASGGTLFLDEIGDLPLDMQVNLLRFLEDHKIQRVGGLDEISVDVRILAATNVDLERAVEEGKFREDLYHRLNVLQVTIPPLRERPSDIETLAVFFFEKFSEEKASRVKGFSKESITRMQKYAWPGNVRELINRIRRALVMCEGRLIKPEDLGLERRQSYRQPITLEKARDGAECKVIKAALARNKNNIQRTAKELSVSRVTLYRLIEKHRIERKEAHVSREKEASSPFELRRVSTV